MISSRELPTHCPQWLLLPLGLPWGHSALTTSHLILSTYLGLMRKQGNPLADMHHEGLTDDPSPGRAPKQCLARTVVSHWMNPPAFSFPSAFLTFGKENMACPLVKDGPHLLAFFPPLEPWFPPPEPSTSSSCPQHCPSLSDVLFLTFHRPLPYQRPKTCFYQDK